MNTVKSLLKSADEERLRRFFNEEFDGVRGSRCMNLAFAGRKEREVSFSTWPPQIAQRPFNLVEFGFFYSGCGDSIHCFYCSFTCRQIGPLLDIQKEHLNLNPWCLFAKVTEDDRQVPEGTRDDPGHGPGPGHSYVPHQGSQATGGGGGGPDHAH